MSQTDYSYLRNDFVFHADKENPRGLDFRGIDMIRSMPTKIDIVSLREHFCSAGQMDGKSYQDFIFEVKRTRRKH